MGWALVAGGRRGVVMAGRKGLPHVPPSRLGLFLAGLALVPMLGIWCWLVIGCSTYKHQLRRPLQHPVVLPAAFLGRDQCLVSPRWPHMSHGRSEGMSPPPSWTACHAGATRLQPRSRLLSCCVSLVGLKSASPPGAPESPWRLPPLPTCCTPRTPPVRPYS